MQSELLHVSRLGTMGEMATALAHELNQPLAAMTNYLQGSRRLLERSPDKNAKLLMTALEKAANNPCAPARSYSGCVNSLPAARPKRMPKALRR